MKIKPQQIARKHIRWCVYAISAFLILLGLTLMDGEGSSSDAFRPEIFSIQRIKVAPLLCITGYLLVIVGIMLPQKHNGQNHS